MSALAGLVDVTKSMIVIDTQRFPVNLQKVYREDLPDASFKILAYEARNVMPTPVGYRSYFSDYTLLGVEPVPSDYCQWVLSYQTSDYSTILIAACEEGLYWCGATQGAGATQWQQIAAGNSVNPSAPVFHLWTHAVISNRLFIYCQGKDKFYCIGSIADIDNLVSAATNYSGASVVKTAQSINDYKFAVASVVPTFLNMAGQIGLFRADNRLGFWDSDNAIAWSSAIYAGDFTPSTETFAGVTTFADVVGYITMVYGHGDDFIIYSTRSIVQAKNVEGSNEKWAGSAILSDTGVSFYNQIAPGQPDTTHYAITSSGLCRIQNNVPQFFETEVSDYLMEENDYYALSFIDGRYLFMHTTSDLVPSVVEVDAKKVVDATNGTYYFVPTTDNSGNTNLVGTVRDLISGADSAVQSDFKQGAVPTDAANKGAGAAAVGQTKTMVPCYSGHNFKTSWDDEFEVKGTPVRSWYPESTVSQYIDNLNVEVKLFPGSFYDLDEVTPTAKPELSFSTMDSANRFLDQGGDKFQDLLTKNIVQINKFLNREQELMRKFNDVVGIYDHPANIPTVNPKALDGFTGGILLGSIINRQVVKDYKLDGVILPQDLKWTMNHCVYECLAIKEHNYVINGYAYGQEMLTLNLSMVAIDEVVYQIWGTVVDDALGSTSGDYHHVRMGDLPSPFKGYLVLDHDDIPEVALRGIDAWITSPAGALKYFTEKSQLNKSNDFTKFAYILLTAPSYIRNAGKVSAMAISNYIKAYYDTHANVDDRHTLDSISSLASFINLRYVNEWILGKWSVSSIRLDVTQAEWENGMTGVSFEARGNNSDGSQYGAVRGYLNGEQVSGQGASNIPKNIGSVSGFSNPTCRYRVEGVGYGWVEDVGSVFYPEYRTNYVKPEEARSAIIAAIARKKREDWVLVVNVQWDVKEEVVDKSADPKVLFRAENSGWGYINELGTLVKTHSRNEGSNVCIPGTYPALQNPKPTDQDAGAIGKDPIVNLPTTPGIQPPEPPTTWPYPEPVKIPDIAALFRKGTPAPFYPTYGAAIVYDFLLEKYGRYSNKHKQIYSLLPTNRADSTVTPVKDLGLRGGFLRTDRKLGYFSPDAPDAEIVYGRFGSYRLGVTRGTKAVARFKGKTNGTMIVECSLDGAQVEPGLTQALEFKDAVTVEFFFTRTAKWFNIRIRGKFDLVGLSFESDPRGRR